MAVSHTVFDAERFGHSLVSTEKEKKLRTRDAGEESNFLRYIAQLLQAAFQEKENTQRDLK